MTAEEEDHEIEWLSRVIGIAVVAFFFVQLALTGLTLVTVQQLREVNSDSNEILEAVQEPSLVVSWELRALFEEATVDLDPLPFEGTFVCSELVTDEIFIQFQSDFRAVAPGIPALLRTRQNPVSSELVCSGRPVPFEVPWDQVSGLDSMDGPHEYFLVITADAEGYEVARAESESFILRPEG